MKLKPGKLKRGKLKRGIIAVGLLSAFSHGAGAVNLNLNGGQLLPWLRDYASIVPGGGPRPITDPMAALQKEGVGRNAGLAMGMVTGMSLTLAQTNECFKNNGVTKTIWELTDVVHQYLEKNEAERKKPADAVMRTALLQGFKCAG